MCLRTHSYMCLNRLWVITRDSNRCSCSTDVLISQQLYLQKTYTANVTTIFHTRNNPIQSDPSSYRSSCRSLSSYRLRGWPGPPSSTNPSSVRARTGPTSTSRHLRLMNLVPPFPVRWRNPSPSTWGRRTSRVGPRISHIWETLEVPSTVLGWTVKSISLFFSLRNSLDLDETRRDLWDKFRR